MVGLVLAGSMLISATACRKNAEPDGSSGTSEVNDTVTFPGELFEKLDTSKGPYGSVLPKPVQAKTLVVLDAKKLSKDELVMIGILQGVLAQSSDTQIYLSRDHYTDYLEMLRKDYGVKTENADSAEAVVERFKSKLKGYILYAPETASVQVATTLSGIKSALAVTPALEAMAKKAGLKQLDDVRTRDEEWLFNTYWKQINHDLIIEQPKTAGSELRDLAAMAKAMVIYGNTDFKSKVLKSLNPHAKGIGYGDYAKGENVFIDDYSKNDRYLIADGLVINTTVFCGYTLESLKQPNRTAQVKADSKKHYLAFQVSDGDNVQYVLNAMYAFPNLYSYKGRENWKVGWGVAPVLIDYAPSVMKHYYQTAGKNTFTCAASGMGYFYPSLMSPTELSYQCKVLNEYIDRTDMRIVQILDHNSFFNGSLWDKYTEQKNVDGLIYENYGNNEDIAGRIRFSNGKPVIAPRLSLWESDEAKVKEEVANIIQATRDGVHDPTSPAGYTMVFVQAWGSGMKGVEQVLKQLPADVEVVTPIEMLDLIKKNVKPVSYDFSKDAEGWKIETYSDDASGEWVKSGAIQLRGQGGETDGSPDAEISKKLELPADRPWINVLVKSNSASMGGQVRIRCVDEYGTETIVKDWTPLEQGTLYSAITCRLPGIMAGETVTLYIERDSGGTGKPEYLNIENIEFIGG